MRVFRQLSRAMAIRDKAKPDLYAEQAQEGTVYRMMKLAILEKDPIYLNRLASALSARYADQFEVYSYTSPETALSALDEIGIDVLLAAEAFEIDAARLPGRCGFAYLVDSSELNTLRGQTAIGKFQKADLIYKGILGVRSGRAGSVSANRQGGGTAAILAFTPVSGGSGSSTAAAACALHAAVQGKRTLYLNLEKLGSAGLFFHAEGQYTMSDVISALKSQKTDFAFTLERCVRRDPRGVFFVSPGKPAPDMLELGPDDVMNLVRELRQTASYDLIVLDFDLSLDRRMIEVYRQAHTWVWVGDGTEISNKKISRAFAAVAALEQTGGTPLTGKITLLYNQFNNKTGKTLADTGIKILGGAPKFEQAAAAQAMEKLSAMGIFDRLLYGRP